MKISVILISIVFLASCSNKTIPLTGKYPSPYLIETTNSFDLVWDRLIDLFAQKGLSIKIIDRSSGLVVSERYKMSTTTENKYGKLVDSSAFVVVPKVYNAGTRKLEPGKIGVMGEWNVRIKVDKGKTIINVNIVNITSAELSFYSKTIGTEQVACKECKSTGIFESMISDMIK